jgi:hypothetical protein
MKKGRNLKAYGAIGDKICRLIGHGKFRNVESSFAERAGYECMPMSEWNRYCKDLLIVANQFLNETKK